MPPSGFNHRGFHKFTAERIQLPPCLTSNRTYKALT